jgi:hypothetical protein
MMSKATDTSEEGSRDQYDDRSPSPPARLQHTLETFQQAEQTRAKATSDKDTARLANKVRRLEARLIEVNTELSQVKDNYMKHNEKMRIYYKELLQAALKIQDLGG